MSSSLADLKAFRNGIQPAIPATETSKELAETAAELVLKSVGEDIRREGLIRTPVRFAKAMREMCAGYAITLPEAIGEGVFAAEGRGLVTVKDVEFYSFCEHHMLPFFGKVSVAYYPNEKILGLSKVPRIVEMFARRFQVQERLTKQIADAIQSSIAPRAVVVRATAVHMCMMMRGVKKQDSETSTEFALGVDSLSESERARIWHGI